MQLKTELLRYHKFDWLNIANQMDFRFKLCIYSNLLFAGGAVVPCNEAR